MTKLPLWATVKAAYGAVWAHPGLLVRFALVPLVLAVAADFWLQKLAVETGAEMIALEISGPALRNNVFLLLPDLVPGLLLIPFVAQSYRLFLRGPAAVAGDGLLRIGREAWGLAAVAVLVFAVLNLPLNIMVGFIGFGGALPGLAAALYAVVLVAIGIRLIFVYPVICLGRPWALPARWRETRGNFLRLLGALVAAVLPPWALIVAVSLLMPPLLYEARWPELWPVAALLPQVAVGLAVAALSAAVTVIAFATLSGYPAEGVELPAKPDAPDSAGP